MSKPKDQRNCTAKQKQTTKKVVKRKAYGMFELKKKKKIQQREKASILISNLSRKKKKKKKVSTPKKKKKKHNFSTLIVLFHPLRLSLYNSMHVPDGFI